MNKLLLLVGAVLLTTSISAQKVKDTSAKIEFKKYPTVPVEGLNTLGIQVFTADMPFNHDSLRLYLNNLDMMMSDAEQASKIKHQALNEINVIGGEGDLTVDMALGMSLVSSKELKTSSCMGKKSDCTQYYYKVKYYLPAVVQIRKGAEVYGTWDLNPEIDLRFGNEQTETQNGSTTTIRVTEYRSEADLELALNDPGNGDLARKAILHQISAMVDVIYDQVFFDDTKMKTPISFGSGKATDYTETETAAEAAVEALEAKNYAGLNDPIAIWNKWLEKSEPKNKKAAVNKKVSKGLHENLAIAYTFQGEFEKAKMHIQKCIELANMGNKNLNEISRLEKFQTFIEEKEKALQHNADVAADNLTTAPNIKKMIGKRKLNADMNFLFAEDKYQEMKSN